MFMHVVFLFAMDIQKLCFSLYSDTMCKCLPDKLKLLSRKDTKICIFAFGSGYLSLCCFFLGVQ